MTIMTGVIASLIWYFMLNTVIIFIKEQFDLVTGTDIVVGEMVTLDS